MASRTLRRLITVIDGIINRGTGSRLNPMYHTGAITMAMLAAVLVSGLYVFVFYRIGPERSYVSVAALEASAFGGFMRSLHRYASDGLILAAGAHALRMLLNGRFRGNAAAAWYSGVGLVLFSLVEGLTGYFLVWDRQAQVLAQGMFRLMDVLPVFGEPLSRSLLSQSSVSGMLFFIMLFLHVMLAVAVLVFLWFHVTRVAQPRVVLPRPLAYGILALLVATALFWPARSNPPADLDAIPTNVRLDFFYLFGVPVLQRLGPAATWGLAGAGVLVIGALPLWARRRATAAPRVAQQYCNGCRQCYLDCPYDGITMRPRTDSLPFVEEAVIDPDRCARCGVCVGSCSTGAIELQGMSLRSLQPRIAEAVSPAGGRTLVVSCGWSAGGQPGALAGIPGVAALTVPCIGAVHPFLAEHALRAGASNVLLVGCPAEGGPFRLGNRWLEMRLEGERKPALRPALVGQVGPAGPVGQSGPAILTLGAGAGEVGRLRQVVAELQAEVV